ncbi:MAG: class I SAM-dependent methyltransferase [Candidatus Omnitrophica bacterium]|nr:class I SAM-dependent methyltransferase [Candidatus Omnitrophota bacterium]MDD5436732.1 class I SAM-dependent methyltransferase [Candidatus Omnitrophota bacterium]
MHNKPEMAYGEAILKKTIGDVMEDNCPFCQNSDVYIYKRDQKARSGDSRSIYKCRKCSALYPYPKFNKAESSKHLLSISTNQDGYKFDDPTRAVSHRNPLVKILRKCTKCRGTALDIGTFDGRFCFILGTVGFRAYGVEPQKNAVEFARKHGLEVFQGSFPEAVPEEVCGRKYDLISLMEILCYVDNIEKTLRMINGMLNDDGCLLIKNHQGYSRYYDSNSYFSRYGDYIQCILTIESLRYYLNLTGFKIVKITGETSTDLLPLGMGRIRNAFLGKVVNKIYNFTMLEHTLLDIKRADRLIITAKKI